MQQLHQNIWSNLSDHHYHYYDIAAGHGSRTYFPVMVITLHQTRHGFKDRKANSKNKYKYKVRIQIQIQTTNTYENKFLRPIGKAKLHQTRRGVKDPKAGLYFTLLQPAG